MKHEPCRFLRDVKITRNLVTADTVLAVDDKPHCSEPLVERNRGILKHRSRLHGELFPALFVHALPDAPGGEIRLLRAATVGAYRAVRPPHCRHKLYAYVRVAKVASRL